MITPRDREWASIGDGRAAVSPDWVALMIDGVHVHIRRADFNRIVDWYIGADAIRAYVAKHERDPIDEWRASVIRRMAENTDRLMSRREAQSRVDRDDWIIRVRCKHCGLYDVPRYGICPNCGNIQT